MPVGTTDPKNKWFSATNAERKRPLVTVTMSPEGRDALDELCELTGEKRGQLVERLIIREVARVRKKAK